jgi:hypothetical protein
MLVGRNKITAAGVQTQMLARALGNILGWPEKPSNN